MIHVLTAQVTAEPHLLGAFEKLQKATIGFDMSVRLSAWNNTAPTGRIFMKSGI
jgi:hypothetical protein